MRKHIATIHEPTTDVIACTLDGDGAERRLEEWAELRERHLVSIEALGNGLRLRFDAGAAEAAEDLAAREAGCCGFLRIEVTRGADVVLSLIHI